MAAYTTPARIQSILGTAVYTEIVAIAGVDVTATIAEASDVIAARLRNSGYSPPTSTDGTGIGDANVCLATEALVVRKLCATPEISLSLPDGWDQSMHVLALEGILSGDLTLSLSLTNISAVGGAKFTDSSETLSVADGGRPQRASRKELIGY